MALSCAMPIASGRLEDAMHDSLSSWRSSRCRWGSGLAHFGLRVPEEIIENSLMVEQNLDARCPCRYTGVGIE